MKTLTTAVVALVLVIVAIAANNWHLVIETVPVDLGVTTANFSLALLLLIGLVIVSILYFATIGRIRMQSAVESRDLHRELDRARRSAETAEASRLADLRAYLDREVPQIELKLDQVLERLGGVPVPAGVVRTSAPPTSPLR